MEVITTDQWDENLWSEAEPIYRAAFPEHGRKKRAIIQNMFHKHMCCLHLGKLEGQPVAMAITGWTANSPALIIDYFAVREDQRGKGIGGRFFLHLKNWAIRCGKYAWLLIEIESEHNETNASRAHFWSQAGFRHTDYVYQYIWVPERYRAMYLPLAPGNECTDGEHLFSYMTRFHKECFAQNGTGKNAKASTNHAE